MSGTQTIGTRVSVPEQRGRPTQNWAFALATLRSHRGGKIMLKFGPAIIERDLDNLGLARDIAMVLRRSKEEALPGWAFSVLKGISVALRWAAVKSTYRLGQTPVLAIHRLAKAPVMATEPNPFPQADALSDKSVYEAAQKYRAHSKSRQLQSSVDARLRKKARSA